MPRTAKRMVLTKEEAARAIYVDFEGNTDKSPTVLGVLYQRDGIEGVDGEVLEQWIVEHAFDGAVGSSACSLTGAADLTELTVRLVQMAKRERRRIVSWSMHDYSKFAEVLSGRPRMLQALGRRHRNAIRTGRQWAKASGTGGAIERHSQSTYMAIVEYAVPSDAGPGKTGESLRQVREMLGTYGNDWSRLTRTKQERFVSVLKHNRHDLYGMRTVVQQAAGALDVRRPER